MFELKFIFVPLLYMHMYAITYAIYLHKHICHKTLYVNYYVRIIMATWMWLSYTPAEPDAAKKHIPHHQYPDTENDPHSPKILGMRVVMIDWLFFGFVERIYKMFTSGFKKFPLPENKVYEFDFLYSYPHLGNVIFFALNIMIFGFVDGIIMGLLGIFATTFFYTTFAFGLAHGIGYRNYNTNDNSRNIFPLGILFAGEELHNNHHQSPYSLCLKRKWFEFDLGYYYIMLLCKFNLCKKLTK
jgi:stearoyl-CoA desaturase (delta-9 desaturase)